jgi:hypothetical protein
MALSLVDKSIFPILAVVVQLCRTYKMYLWQLTIFVFTLFKRPNKDSNGGFTDLQKKTANVKVILNCKRNNY